MKVNSCLASSWAKGQLRFIPNRIESNRIKFEHSGDFLPCSCINQNLSNSGHVWNCAGHWLQINPHLHRSLHTVSCPLNKVEVLLKESCSRWGCAMPRSYVAPWVMQWKIVECMINGVATRCAENVVSQRNVKAIIRRAKKKKKLQQTTKKIRML